MAPNVPGFHLHCGLVTTVPAFFASVYAYSWFVGLPLAGLVYWELESWSRRRERGSPGEVVSRR